MMSKPMPVPSYDSCCKMAKGMTMSGSMAATKGSKVKSKSMAPRGRMSGAWMKNPHQSVKPRDFSN